MSVFCCPVCGQGLTKADHSLLCPNGHCFDLARQGYVNLLLSNQPGTKRHGDDRLMVQARQSFLERGYYQPILDGILSLLSEVTPPDCLILDAGCGEGWYTAGVARVLQDRGCRLCGVDISREAVKTAAQRKCGAELAVASVAHMPLPEGSCGVVLNLFSPLEPAEYERILKPEGILLRAVPLEQHLMSLKAAVYETPYPNDPPERELPGFHLLRTLEIRQSITIATGEDLQNLFAMTPYYYKTGAQDQQKLLTLDHLTTQLEVELQCYGKEKACDQGKQS